MTGRKRVVIIGASYRGMHGFIKNIMEYHSEGYSIEAVCDINRDKIRDLNDFLKTEFRAYTDVDQMLDEIRPDIAIVASVDFAHAAELEKTLMAGVDTIVEKPLCVDAGQCRSIRAAIKKSENKVELVTAHNLRYHPAMLKIKEILDAGRIGKVLSVNFTELLDRDHGASYFHRWNRVMKNSGGLLVHKSSHHFDLLNWFVGSRAEEVSAHGGLLVYGAENSPFDQKEIAATCHECPKTSEECLFRSSLGTGVRYQLYKSSLASGGYTPDLCVYSPEIDIHDHVGVGIRYENGIQACYTLCAHACVESMRIEIEGVDGRLEYEIIYNANLDASKSEGDASPHLSKLRIVRFNGSTEDIEVPEVKGGHGGADVLMCRDLFGASASQAKASIEDGIQAVLTGIAANESIKQRRTISVQKIMDEQ